MKTNKLLVAAVLAIAIGAPIVGFVGDINMAQPTTSHGVRVPFLHGLPTGQTAGQAELASLERANEWLNSPPLTAAALRGKVVLVDFWTYTCINWLRTLPYVRAWAEKYKDQGLVVIGVHAPEFRFEKNIDNVRRAVKELRVDYPVAVDSDMSSGAPSRTNIGRRCISSMRRGASGISISARARTNSRKWSFSNCWPRPGPAASATTWYRSMRAASKWPPIGQPQVSGKLCRLRAHRGLCVAGRRGPRQASHV